jgi:hypothetical protein
MTDNAGAKPCWRPLAAFLGAEDCVPHGAIFGLPSHPLVRSATRPRSPASSAGIGCRWQEA